MGKKNRSVNNMKQRSKALELTRRTILLMILLAVIISSTSTAYAPVVKSATPRTSVKTISNQSYILKQLSSNIVGTFHFSIGENKSIKQITHKVGMEDVRRVALISETEATTEKSIPTTDPQDKVEVSVDKIVLPVETVEEETEPTYPALSEIDESTPTEKRILAMFGFFISEGFTPEASAGIIGNIAIESTFDPTAVSSSGYYHGLCQWNTTDGGMHWWDGEGGIIEWLDANGYSWDSFEGQVKAIVYCDRKGYLTGETLEKFMAMDSVEKAAELFCRKYEGGTGIDGRVSEAKYAYELYQNPEGEYAGNKAYTVPVR